MWVEYRSDHFLLAIFVKNPCGTYVQNFASRFEIEFPIDLLND